MPHNPPLSTTFNSPCEELITLRKRLMQTNKAPEVLALIKTIKANKDAPALEHPFICALNDILWYQANKASSALPVTTLKTIKQILAIAIRLMRNRTHPKTSFPTTGINKHHYLCTWATLSLKIQGYIDGCAIQSIINKHQHHTVTL